MKKTMPFCFSGDVDDLTPEQVLKQLVDLNCAPISGPPDLIPVFGFLDDGGYEGSAYFILISISTFEFYEISGSHCSCYGFEYQFDATHVPLEYLEMHANWPQMKDVVNGVLEYFIEGIA